MKSSEVSIKTRSTPASLTIQGQVTKDPTVKMVYSMGQFQRCSSLEYLISLLISAKVKQDLHADVVGESQVKMISNYM